MIGLPPGTKVWIAAGVTDMRRGFDGLSAQVQTVLRLNPLSGHVFVFRGRSGDRVKVLFWDGQGICLFYKRIEKTTFVWPRRQRVAKDGKGWITPAQLASLLEWMDWWLTRALPQVPQPTTAV